MHANCRFPERLRSSSLSLPSVTAVKPRLMRASINTESGPKAVPKATDWGAWGVAAVFNAGLAVTRSNVLGDTELYASNIVTHLGQSPVAHGSSLWEFGHLLWRPLGWAVLTVFGPVLSALSSWTAFQQACFILIALSVASGTATVMLWYLLGIDVTGSRRVAFGVAATVAFNHGFLLYAHAGCAYIPGVFCLTASIFSLRRKRLVAGAIFYAIAVLLWLPYILAGAALVALAALPNSRWGVAVQDNLRSIRISGAFRFTAIAAICVVLAWGLALAARRTSSIKEAREWFAESQHGWSQNIKAVRIVTGLPRSFLYLGKDGVLYRRFVRHDPFAPVHLLDLVKASLWRIAFFHLYLICLIWEMVRARRASWVPELFLLAACPVVFFAVVLFEPGSPERYLPALPFLLIATAWALRDFPRGHRLTQIIIGAFLVCTLMNNGVMFFLPRISARDSISRQRVWQLRPRFNTAGLLALATNQDEIEAFVSRSPFDSINRPQPLPIYDVIEPATLRVLSWREEFAQKATETWKQNGEVWISRRLWAPTPQPEWDWVEGDDPRISWAQIPPFFASLQTDAESGGADGFLRLKKSTANLSILQPLADKLTLAKP